MPLDPCPLDSTLLALRLLTLDPYLDHTVVPRTLEMQAANLDIEVRTRQTDLEAAKARVHSLGKTN